MGWGFEVEKQNENELQYDDVASSTGASGLLPGEPLAKRQRFADALLSPSLTPLLTLRMPFEQLYTPLLPRGTQG